MDTIIVICAFLLMTTAMLVVSIRKFNELTEDMAAINSDVCEMQAWVSIAEDKQKQKEQEEKKKQEKENANYLIKFIEPEFQKIIDNSKDGSEAINNIIDKIKPIITETAYIELKGKSMKMLSEANIKKYKELLKCINATNKDGDVKGEQR